MTVLFSGFALSASAQPLTDITASSGLALNGIKDGGQTWADFNGDGYLDVVVNTSGRSHLFFQRPGADPLFEDVTATNAVGLSRLRGERSVVAADLNNDGYVDFARTDQQLLEVYLNGGSPDYVFGSGAVPSFVSDPSTDPDLRAYEGLGVVDWNDDGYLDLVMDNDGELRIYQNPADGSAAFVYLDPTATGIPDPGPEGDYIAVADWDVDGLVDFGHRRELGGDLLHREADGSVTQIDLGDLYSDTSRRGGITFCDIDNDGDFDVFYTSGYGTGINQAWIQTDGAFALVPQPDLTSTNNDDVDCGDLDNDGDLDLYYSQNNLDDAFMSQLADSGDLTFVNVTDNVATHDGEGVVFVDFDNDGDLDVYVNQWGGVVTDPTTMTSMETPADNALLRNDTDDDNYLAVTVLAEVQGCPDASVTRVDHGAVARLERPGWQSGAREVSGGDGHGTQGSPVLHFGLGESPDVEHVLTVWFQYGDLPQARIRVTPSALGAYQHLTVVGSDADGDGIPTAVEMADAGENPDLDGDGFDAWNDTDADGDGILDADEAGDDDPCTPPVDTDADGIPEYLDTVVGSPDGGVVTDGGLPDASSVDAAPVDSEPFDPQLISHGSGCIQCATASAADDRRGLLATCLVLLLAARRRRRG